MLFGWTSRYVLRCYCQIPYSPEFFLWLTWQNADPTTIPIVRLAEGSVKATRNVVGDVLSVQMHPRKSSSPGREARLDAGRPERGVRPHFEVRPHRRSAGRPLTAELLRFQGLQHQPDAIQDLAHALPGEGSDPLAQLSLVQREGLGHVDHALLG